MLYWRMNEELLNTVYRKGFAKLGTKESIVNSKVAAKYKEMCKQIIHENEEQGLELLVIQAELALRLLLKNLDVEAQFHKEPL